MPGGGYQPQVDPRSVTPDGQPLAGWWHRVAARILDGIILLVLGLVLGNLFMPGFFADYLDWSMTQTDPLRCRRVSWRADSSGSRCSSGWSAWPTRWCW